MNVYTKLQKARIELQNKDIKKSGFNKFNNFKYFELTDFIPQINQIFNDLQLTSVFSVMENKAVLKIINIENPEEVLIFESIIAQAQIKGAQPIQNLGAIHTYLKRYLYYNALEIVESDTVDALDNQQGETPYKQKENNTDIKVKAIKYIEKNQNKYKNDISSFLQLSEVKSLNELNVEELKTLCDIIKNKENL